MSTYLTAPDLGRLDLDDAHGYTVTKLDLGFPTVRGVTSNRVNASGADDSTAFYGPRAVSIEVVCHPPEDGSATRRDVMARLRAYASPSRRAALVFSEDDDGVHERVVLRGDGGAWPLERAVPGIGIRVQLTFVAPEGIIEDADATVVEVSAFADTGAPGRTYPRTYPVTYPRRSALGAGYVENATEAAAPVYRLFGPCVNPSITNVETGATLRFGNASTGDLTLTADQYIEVDVREATAWFNGRRTDPAFARIDLATSAFPWLVPGLNRVRYTPQSFTAGAHATVTYRRARL